MTDARISTAIRTALEPIRGKIMGLVRRAALAAIQPGLGQQLTLTSTNGDSDDGVELFEPYGFTSVPPGSSEGLVLRVSGSRAESVAILFGDRSVRFNVLASNEVAVYNDSGASVVLRNTGNIEATPGPGGVVQLGGPAAVLPVARVSDSTIMSITDIASINAMIALFNAPIAPMVSLGPGIIAPVDGKGTITSGGNGSTST